MRTIVTVGLVLIAVLAAAHALLDNLAGSPCVTVGNAPLSGDCR